MISTGTGSSGQWEEAVTCGWVGALGWVEAALTQVILVVPSGMKREKSGEKNEF